MDTGTVIDALGVHDLEPDLHQLRDIYELAEAGVHAEAGPVRGHLQSRFCQRELVGPGVEVRDAERLQGFQLEVPLHGKQLGEGVGDRRTGQPNHFPTVFMQPAELHEHVEGALGVRVGQPGDAGHAGGEEQVFVGVEFIHDQHVHAQLLERDRACVVLRHVRQVVELDLEAFDALLDLLHRPRIRLALLGFEFLEIFVQRINLALIEIRQGVV